MEIGEQNIRGRHSFLNVMDGRLIRCTTSLRMKKNIYLDVLEHLEDFIKEIENYSRENWCIVAVVR